MNHQNTHGLDVVHGMVLLRNNLEDLGFVPRDADGNDYQRGADKHLRFKIGSAYMEITTLVMLDDKQQEALRATSYSGMDRMLLAIRGYVDKTPPGIVTRASQ